MEEQEQTPISLIAKYSEEIKKYVSVDEFNMKQIQMDLPATRHYWVGRLMFHKQEILKLKRLAGLIDGQKKKTKTAPQATSQFSITICTQ